ncbi:hypothetical protein MRX96_003631 [Rhipicephalus microplus]
MSPHGTPVLPSVPFVVQTLGGRWYEILGVPRSLLVGSVKRVVGCRSGQLENEVPSAPVVCGAVGCGDGGRRRRWGVQSPNLGAHVDAHVLALAAAPLHRLAPVPDQAPNQVAGAVGGPHWTLLREQPYCRPILHTHTHE